MAETVKDLRAKAKAAGIKGYSRMRKAQLEKALDAVDGYDAAANSAGCYTVAITHMRNKLESFRKEVIGDCTLYLGDCREILPLLAHHDAVVTDPPYGIGIAANPVRQRHAKKAWDNTVPEASLFALMASVAKHQVIWGGNYFGLPANQCFLVWDKVQPQDFSLAMCEQAWTNIAKPAKLFRRHAVSYEKHHPTQKPVELMRWCLEQLPEPAERVLDPFMGSGTTGVACAMAGLGFTGIEVDPAYFDIACRRIRQAYDQPDMFVPAPAKPIEQLSLIAAE
jgi:hypothetical protein